MSRNSVVVYFYIGIDEEPYLADTRNNKTASRLLVNLVTSEPSLQKGCTLFVALQRDDDDKSTATVLHVIQWNPRSAENKMQILPSAEPSPKYRIGSTLLDGLPATYAGDFTAGVCLRFWVSAMLRRVDDAKMLMGEEPTPSTLRVQARAAMITMRNELVSTACQGGHEARGDDKTFVVRAYDFAYRALEAWALRCFPGHEETPFPEECPNPFGTAPLSESSVTRQLHVPTREAYDGMSHLLSLISPKEIGGDLIRTSLLMPVKDSFDHLMTIEHFVPELQLWPFQ